MHKGHNCDCGQELTTDASLCANCYEHNCSVESHRDGNCYYFEFVEAESQRQDREWEAINNGYYSGRM